MHTWFIQAEINFAEFFYVYLIYSFLELSVSLRLTCQKLPFILHTHCDMKVTCYEPHRMSLAYSVPSLRWPVCLRTCSQACFLQGPHSVFFWSGKEQQCITISHCKFVRFTRIPFSLKTLVFPEVTIWVTLLRKFSDDIPIYSCDGLTDKVMHWQLLRYNSQM